MIYLVTNQTSIESSFPICNISHVLNWAKTKEYIGVDTETTGFDPHECKIILTQLGDYNDQFVIDCNTVDIRQLQSVFKSKSKLLFWNAKFDLKHLKTSGIECDNVIDCMITEVILHTGETMPGYSLKQAGQTYCGIELDKSIRGVIHKQGLTNSVIKYAAEDVMYLESIHKKQYEKVIDLNLQRTFELEQLFTPVLANIEYNGIKIDTNQWLINNQQNKKDLNLLVNKMNDWLIENKITPFIDNQLDLFSNELRSNVKWSSSQQVVKLFKYLNIPTTVRDKKTGEDKDSVEAKHISKYKSKSSFIPIYLEYKEKEKLISTYGEKFIRKNLNKVTKRIHSDFWQIVDTGRISSRNPNMQNIPSDEIIRKCFIPEEGNLLIISDYSQQEPRVLADLCQDENLLKLFLEGDGDTHTLVTEKMFSIIEGKPVKIDKKDPRRQIGKILNLKLNYGGSAYTVKDDLNTTEEEAQKFIDALEKAFPQKETYFKKVIQQTFNNGYILIDKVTNRKCFIPEFETYNTLKLRDKNGFTKDDWRVFYTLKGKFERMSKNYPIQGLSGSMTKLACIYVEKELKDLGKIVNIIHDEILVECKKENAELVAKIVKEQMERAGKVFCKTIPQIVEPNISNYWLK